MSDRGPRGTARIDAARIEEAGLNALQTQRQLFYDGWLLRVSPGKAKRARSVNAHFGSSLPLPVKIAHCAAVYAQHGLPLLFRITPFVNPRALDTILAAYGFVEFDETLVMATPLPVAAAARPLPAGSVLVEPGVPEFVDVVGDLRGSPPPQRAAHRERLAQSLLASRFVVLHAGERPVCAAQLAVDGDLAGVYDVVTVEDARGRGYATFACATLLAWAAEQGARAAYLQVSADNAPAIALYRKFGFAPSYTYHYRARPGECR
jgi:GNAT superfamily N-acetyltransferase